MNPAGLYRSKRLVYWLSSHWLLAFGVLYGLFVLLPFLAPFFMHIGWDPVARAIYFAYSFLCHQLPDRSFYFFGSQFMIDLNTVRAAWMDTAEPLLLRTFTGNPVIGWKTAWSDRMVSLYGSIWIAGLLWGVVRGRVRALPLWGLVMLTLPLAVDGTTHFVSDLGGIEQGFRYTNDWLAALTGNAFPPGFYAGNSWGSFNAWMRLVSGVLFGAGIVGYGFPILEDIASGFRKQIDLQREALTRLQAYAAPELSGEDTPRFQ